MQNAVTIIHFYSEPQEPTQKVMRLDIVLLAAALFACVNTSSTSSISRTVRFITSKQEDVAARELGVETTKEERMSNFFESDNIASNYIEKIKHLFPRGSETNVMDAYKLLRLDKDNITWLRNVRSKAWGSYVKKRLSTLQSTKSTMNEEPRLYENEGILKLLDHLERFEDKKDLYDKLKSALMASWKDNKETPRYVFEQLKLDVKPPLHHFIDINRLELWFNYVFYNCKSPVEEITKVMNSYDDKFRVMFLGRFRKLNNTKNVVTHMESTLLSSWVNNKLPVEKVYDTLDLQFLMTMHALICGSHMWSKYVIPFNHQKKQ